MIGFHRRRRRRQEPAAASRLHESEERFRLLAEAVPSVVWLAAADGTITYANERWFRYTGLTIEENARWVEEVLHPDDRERCLGAWSRALAEGSEYEIEVRNRRHDGEYRWFLTRAVPLRDDAGRILAWVGSATDIDDRKRSEEALQRADRRKDEFLATLAHELRNPLAAIQNAVELAARAEDDRELRRRAWGMMERQLRQLVRLVDDLLDVSRISRGKVELRRQRMDLLAAVRGAVDGNRPLFEARDQALTTALPEQPLWLEGDALRLEQVFANLLNNAAKYTDRGGHVWLEAAREGRRGVVRVRDTGIGIDPQALPQVFELFAQVHDSLERAEGGLGVGLSLVRRLVEMHGGSVEVSSDGPGRGCEFVVRLPLTEDQHSLPPAAPSVEVRPGRPSAAARRILVADDNADSADALSLMLRLLGHQVQTCYDGQEALQAARLERVDVVLLDIGMPRLNGYDVARHIRREPWGRSVKLVAMTGWGQAEDRQRAHEAGFDLHLTKPIDPATLLAWLSTSS